MKFFIMGGTGFIGGSLIKHLLRAEHEVTALARNASELSALRAGFKKMNIEHRTSNIEH